MRKTLKYIIIGVGIVGFIGFASYKIIATNRSAETRRQAATLVKVEKPRRENVVYRLQFNGDVLPIRQANIFSKVGGNLERVYVEMGAYVKENQLLATIDSTELKQQYQQAAATFANLKTTYDRTRELFKKGFAPKSDIDNAEASMKVAKSNFEAAATRLSYSRILAPFSGYITKRFLDPGALVTPSNSTLFTLMNLDSVKIIVNISEKDIPSIYNVRLATVVLDALPDVRYDGIVSRYSEAIDLSTRTMAVEINVHNKDHKIKPGMFATISLVVTEHANSLTVPSNALLRDDEGQFVYVTDNNIVKRLRVKIGTEQSSRTEIVSGLSGEESIITTGQQFVKDGGSVNIQQ